MIDLHIHSIYSDGEYSPDELINKCLNNGIKTISITDHDRIDAYKNMKLGKYINLIPGIELSAKASKGQIHILGYGIDINNKKLSEKLDELKENSINSFKVQIKELETSYNIVFDEKDINSIITSTHNIGRPDIARLLVKYGYVKTSKEAFNKYLIDVYNKTRNIRKNISYRECIELIKEAGGYPILAHPISLEMDKNEFEETLKEMISYGLMGIEVYHSSLNEQERSLYMSLVEKYNLLYTGGSDYHGPFVKPDIELGSGRNNLNIEYVSLLDCFDK